jgi:hypothetical protein
MVKIIKPGKIRIITCPRCDCQFSFEREDVKYGSQIDYFEEVACPCCHKLIDLVGREKGLK